MTTTMRAVLFHKPKDIRLEEVPVPTPGPGEVLIKVGAALTCGTDFKAYRQGHKVLLGDSPARFGHELAGTVAALGAGVSGVKEGDRVVAANSAPCLEGCFFCAKGQPQLCERLKLHNGAYAEYDLLPANIVKSNLYRLAPTVGFATAALAEPLSCAIHAAAELKVLRDETAVIIGAGSMSLLLIQALLARGARVLVCGRSKEHLATAKKAGAHEAYSAEDGDLGEMIHAATNSRGADVIFEAVGQIGTWQQAVSMARKGGRVCLFGGCASGTMVPIDAHRVHYSQLSLHGVFHHTPAHFTAAVNLLSFGAVPVSLLIQGQVALSEIPEFYAKNHEKSNPKVAVLP